MRACLAAGMDQFVARPASRETLLNALMQALSETHASRPQAVEHRISVTGTE